MAKNQTVWGIDVGNTSLKALRCRKGEEPGSLEVLQFDYIEHSKIMSSPGADANEILAETLKLFLSRNDVKGEKIAISVSGQNALWRFQPLPPIDPKKVPDLIKYEVKQWLPFDLQDVIWDYREVGGTVEGGVALDLHIFMYAMKKDVGKRLLQRYAAAGLDVDCLQGAQVALYNAFVNDMYDYESLREKDMNEMNDYDVILNVGTDATEIVVTNGVAVWLRNIPVGGNLFTKALSKQMKLTYSQAEHIKRNANTAQDPKAVIVAMKPVFNDMLTEVDRSIKFYQSFNKKAKIRRVYALGNAIKLPGLRAFLSKSLGVEIVTPSKFNKLSGNEVLKNNTFKENLSSFGVAYGLALQLLGDAPLNINLVPRDLVQQRMIKQKKPWALAAASLIGLGLTAQYFVTANTYNVVQTPALESAQKTAESVASKSKDLIAKANAAVTEFKKFDDIGRNLTSGVEGRLTWMELLKAVNECIPSEAPNKEILSEGVTAIKKEAIHHQNRVYIDNIEVQKIEELGDWFELVRRWYYIDDVEAQAFDIDASGNSLAPEEDAEGSTTGSTTITKVGSEDADAAEAEESGDAEAKTEEPFPKYTLEEMFPFVPASDTKGGSSSSSSSKSSSSSSKSSSSSSSKSSSSSSKSSSSSSDSGGLETTALDEFVEAKDARLELIPAPSGPGRIVQLRGYHYHNPDDKDDPARGAEYLRRTLLYNLKHGSVELPVSLERQRAGEVNATETITLKEMGIYYPVLVNPGVIDDQFRLLDPQAAAEARKELLKKMIKEQPGRAGGASRQSMNGGGAGMRGGSGMGGSSMGGGMSGNMGGGMSNMNNQIANQLSSDKILDLNRYDFTIQFVWMETPPSERDARRKAAEEAEAEAEAGTTDATETTDEQEVGSTAVVDTTENADATDATSTEGTTETTDAADAASTEETTTAAEEAAETPDKAETTEETAETTEQADATGETADAANETDANATEGAEGETSTEAAEEGAASETPTET